MANNNKATATKKNKTTSYTRLPIQEKERASSRWERLHASLNDDDTTLTHPPPQQSAQCLSVMTSCLKSIIPKSLRKTTQTHVAEPYTDYPSDDDYDDGRAATWLS
jgi:hypothetical protein